ncbi:MAG: M3 family oligoendopeptidase, partial [Candidatus Izimaplasma sp.]|nr:M3 family oligoendopeptidase [Candidatus Izimaplasma bacterium]
YKSYSSKEFLEDVEKIDAYLLEANGFKNKFIDKDDPLVVLTDYLLLEIQINTLARKLFSFVSLNSSTNTIDKESARYSVVLQKKFSEFTEVNTLFSKYVSNLEDIDNLLNSSEFLKEHKFYVKEIVKHNKYNLDEKTEGLLSKLNQSGASLFSKLQRVLTSTLEVEYKGEILTLPEIIGKSEDDDPKVRKSAYEAELGAYKKIDKSIAFAMNGIKGQVNTLSEYRGYKSALDRALVNSRMSEETLNAMLDSIKEYLPIFRKYLKRKGELLGHKDGLPWYDLYAPMGKSAKEFTIEEAQLFILKNFASFSPNLENLAKRAFDGNWVDYLPYKGKVGGAFCANLHPIKESRILTNFNGAFGDVITLAHELGHAYHGDNIFSESVLNARYTMPVAETASTFCETIVLNAALKNAEKEEKIYLLESSLQGSTAVVVDILSRYIFESNVFNNQKTNYLDENALKNLMLDAQKEAYGDGLNPDFLHPYMWLWKPHYYSGELSFYNFPYAFGLLFAKGLYGIYQKEGQKFTPKYDALLKSTGKMSVEDVAKLANIDLTAKDFWRTSLDVIKKDIELFLELTKE